MKRYVYSTSELDKLYKGIWFGAKTNPISTKDLLDKVIKYNGSGFTVTRKQKYVGDNLMSDPVTEIYLMDEDCRGKFKLGSESIQYLKDNLPDGSWIRDKLITWTEG